MYDSDLVVKVSTGVRGSEECGTAVALGTEDLFDPRTRRPVLAQLLVCEPSIPEFEFNNMLQAFLHQMFKILVRRYRCFTLSHRHPECIVSGAIVQVESPQKLRDRLL